MTVKLEFRHAVVKYPAFELQIGSLQLGPGVVLFAGANGSGKSTFLRAALGLESELRGQRTTTARSYAYCPQSYRDSLMPWLSAYHNLFLLQPPSPDCVSMLQKLNFDTPDLRKRPDQLSGGQCQRIALVRELMTDADLLVLDEPFSSLDPASVEKAAEMILTYRSQQQLTLIASHITPPLLAERAIWRMEFHRIADSVAEIRSTKESA